MYVGRKSDKGIVPGKPRTKKASLLEERVEERPLTERNIRQPTTRRTQCRGSVSLGLANVRKLASGNKTVQFNALLHHITVEQLELSYSLLKRNATPGVDGLTWQHYGDDVIDNLVQLHKKIHAGKYKALPSKRCYIPKADGTQRGLGIAALEDKIVQHALLTVLTAIYEADFLGFSYGFRPKVGAHDALDAVAVGMKVKKVNWVLDADIQGFFDNMDHEWLQKFLRHRIADKRVLRLITKWLKAGVIEAGKWQASVKGCPQGAIISPLLANIYLHYVLDLWVQSYRKNRVKGDVLIVRYADDFIVGFQHKSEANEFLYHLKKRLNKFSLKLHEQKTKLIRFGRFAKQRRKAVGEGKPETFEFLGFTHICAETHIKQKFVVKRQTSKKRMRKKLQAIKLELMKRRHAPVGQTGEWLNRVLRGYFNYHAVPGNMRVLSNFKRDVNRYWLRSLRRRSQRNRMTWDKFTKLEKLYIPALRRVHDYPHRRFAAKYSK